MSKSKVKGSPVKSPGDGAASVASATGAAMAAGAGKPLDIYRL